MRTLKQVRYPGREEGACRAASPRETTQSPAIFEPRTARRSTTRILYYLFIAFEFACINIQDVAILCNLWYSKTAFINGGKYHGKRIDRSFEGM